MLPIKTDASSIRESGRLDVAILIPATTNKVTNPSLDTLTLTTTCIPSIIATAEPQYNYRLYVGTEDFDFLATKVDELKSMSSGNVEVFPMIVKGGTENKAIQAIAMRAYNDGAEYMCRINDDTKFITKKWTTLGIDTLLHYKPKNVGVVGPTCRQGNTHIMTHDMVHRTHMEIFKYYYPPVFKNWYIDDWITTVYKPGRSTKLTTWEVVHSMKQGTRYVVDFTISKLTEILVTIGNVTIESYVKQKASCQTSRIISYSLYGSDPKAMDGALVNAKLASLIYPGWIVRFYHDSSVSEKVLETLRAENVQLVNIKTKTLEPKEIWNLYVAADPCLERYIIRNLDSRLTKREKTAVDQWVDSGKQFHIIRNNTIDGNHPVPSGMWGGTQAAILDIIGLIHKNTKDSKQFGTVQQFLNKEIWPIANLSVFQQDFPINNK